VKENNEIQNKLNELGVLKLPLIVKDDTKKEFQYVENEKPSFDAFSSPIV